jgi:hypothetical protein
MQPALQTAHHDSNRIFLSQQQQVEALLAIARRAEQGASSQFQLGIPAILFPVLVKHS